MKKLVEVKKVNGRYFHTWDEDENCCIHGIKARWVCDDCADESEEAQPETAGHNAPGVAPTTGADAVIPKKEWIQSIKDYVTEEKIYWKDSIRKYL